MTLRTSPLQAAPERLLRDESHRRRPDRLRIPRQWVAARQRLGGNRKLLGRNKAHRNGPPDYGRRRFLDSGIAGTAIEDRDAARGGRRWLWARGWSYRGERGHGKSQETPL